MSSGEAVKTREYFLRKGYIYIPGNPTLIAAVLGSGVSVCVWDKKQRKGGMNYFLYPESENNLKGRPIYGNVATVALVRFLKEDGSRIEDLEAQIFGGAVPCGEEEGEIVKVASKNVDIARKILNYYHIPVVAEDVGGRKGRKIVFNSYTSDVAIVHVERIRQDDWYPYEGER